MEPDARPHGAASSSWETVEASHPGGGPSDSGTGATSSSLGSSTSSLNVPGRRASGARHSWDLHATGVPVAPPGHSGGLSPHKLQAWMRRPCSATPTWVTLMTWPPAAAAASCRRVPPTTCRHACSTVGASRLAQLEGKPCCLSFPLKQQHHADQVCTPWPAPTAQRVCACRRRPVPRRDAAPDTRVEPRPPAAARGNDGRAAPLTADVRHVCRARGASSSALHPQLLCSCTHLVAAPLVAIAATTTAPRTTSHLPPKWHVPPSSPHVPRLLASADAAQG